jgi:hypothetical protein
VFIAASLRQNSVLPLFCTLGLNPSERAFLTSSGEASALVDEIEEALAAGAGAGAAAEGGVRELGAIFSVLGAGVSCDVPEV